MEKLNEMSNVKKVIGVVSGKGGVGKSLVTSMMAVTMNRIGYKTAILDADITGPSIPRAFGIKDRVRGTKEGINPIKTRTGIELISSNLLLDNDTDPLVWRGSLISSAVKQFWTDVIWQDVDYMFIDMPPGTGDVALTVFQSLPIDGIIMVTSPQELVGMIVGKAMKMAEKMEIPVLALVENMSYFNCPDNGKDYEIFGPSKVEDLSKEYGINLWARLPIDPNIADMCDSGNIEDLEFDYLIPIAKELMKMEEK